MPLTGSKVRAEIDKHANPEERHILHWLLSKYHMESQWRFVARCTFDRYGTLSYQVHRVWTPTREGHILYEQLSKEEHEDATS